MAIFKVKVQCGILKVQMQYDILAFLFRIAFFTFRIVTPHFNFKNHIPRCFEGIISIYTLSLLEFVL